MTSSPEEPTMSIFASLFTQTHTLSLCRSLGRLARLSVLATLTGIATASAQPVFREYLFDVDGMLPSSDPDTDYITGPPGPIIPETQVYSVSSGLLHQRTMGRFGYAEYHSSLPSAGFGAGRELTIEARLRVLAIGSNRNTYFEVDDGVTRNVMALSDSGATLFAASGEVEFYFDVDEGGDFHTYRLESAADDPECRLYQDDVLVGSVSSGMPSAANKWRFGDGAWGAEDDGDVDWDYVRFEEADVTSVSNESAGSPVLAVVQSSPNPFRYRTELNITVPGHERVTVDAYDTTGSFVARLYDGVGGRKAVWDGRNAEGQRVAPGVYFYQMRVGGRAFVNKVVLLSE
jgi:hypothetical protein